MIRMDYVPQITPITEMRLRAKEVLAMLGKGPVILSEAGKAAAVVVAVAEWDKLVDYLDDLECTVDALKMELAIAKNEVVVETLNEAEIAEWLGDGVSA